MPKTTTSDDDRMPLHRIATLIGRSTTVVGRWVAEGRLKKVGTRKDRGRVLNLYRKADAEKLNAECRRQPRPEEDDDQMTAAEVEALVAEQMQNLPDWWFDGYDVDVRDAARAESGIERRRRQLRSMRRKLDRGPTP